MYLDQDRRPMWLAIAGTLAALVIISVMWWHWHAPTEPQQVDSYHVTNSGDITPAQRSQPAVGE
jgi:hypothetical protein